MSSSFNRAFARVTDIVSAIAAHAALLAAPSGSSMAGHIPDGVNAQATTVQAQLRKVVWADKNIPPATNTATTDVSAYIQATLDYAATLGNAWVKFPHGIAFKCDSGLSVDISTTTVDFCGALLDFSGMALGSAITPVRSQTDGNLQQAQAFAHPIKNAILVGPSAANANVKAINLVATGTFISGGAVKDIAFLNFATDVYFDTYSFGWTFDHCTFAALVGAPTTYSVRLVNSANSGEKNVFNDCTWFNRDLVGLFENVNADTYFNNCAFDYCPSYCMQVSGGAVYLDHCHIEHSSDAANWFTVSGSQSLLSVTNSELHIQGAKVNFSPFYSDVSCTSGGVVLDNIRITGSNPGLTIPLIGGAGRTSARNVMFPMATGVGVISEYQNEVAYGDFESASYGADWTLGGGATRSAAQAHTGANSLSFPASAGVSPSALGVWPCKATNGFSAVLWYLAPNLTGSGGTMYITASYLDKGGNVLSVSPYLQITETQAVWAKLNIAPQATPPKGTVSVQISVSIFGVAAGTPTGFIDDVCVNVF